MRLAWPGLSLAQVDETIAQLMRTEPAAAAGLLALNLVGATAVIRFILGNVLDMDRFRHK